MKMINLFLVYICYIIVASINVISLLIEIKMDEDFGVWTLSTVQLSTLPQSTVLTGIYF